MKLLMYLENDLIESVPIDHLAVTQPGYLSTFIRLLKEKYANIIEKGNEEPEFLIENVSRKYKKPANSGS